ncbi:MAG: hypothetical protein GF411_14055 [Candidatus Lokiarchaeota archaeon]|nr:hypothetical protein [Candidatus Lokiarchaeota archaeon]
MDQVNVGRFANALSWMVEANRGLESKTNREAFEQAKAFIAAKMNEAGFQVSPETYDMFGEVGPEYFLPQEIMNTMYPKD